MNKRYLSFFVLMGLALVAGTAQKASAEDVTTGDTRAQIGHHEGFERGPGIWKTQNGVFGVVTGVSGSAITLDATQRQNVAAAVKTYTVDTTNAKFIKNGAESTLSAIAMGDHIMVQGTVNGQNVTATLVRDGMEFGGPREGVGMATGTRASRGRGIEHSAVAGLPTGNGQPVIAGTVTEVRGNAVTITNRGNIPYTVDVTNANIQKAGATSTASGIAVGDNVIVQGSVSGTTITATSFIDRGVMPTVQANANDAPAPQSRVGIWGHVKNFFSRFF